MCSWVWSVLARVGEVDLRLDKSQRPTLQILRTHQLGRLSALDLSRAKVALANAAADGASLANGGQWAYRSQSVNITAAGTYTPDLGPLDASFNYPTDPSGISFDWPSDISFHISPAGSPSEVVLNGDQYLQVSISVSAVTAPYDNF